MGEIKPGLDNAVVDLSDYVTLLHGDLGTYEKVISAKCRRKQERSPQDCLQPVIFTMGLFHLKMVAADAVWWILVTPEGLHIDNTSFIKLVGRLHPDNSSHFIFNAKFWDCHQQLL